MNQNNYFMFISGPYSAEYFDKLPQRCSVDSNVCQNNKQAGLECFGKNKFLNIKIREMGCISGTLAVGVLQGFFSGTQSF